MKKFEIEGWFRYNDEKDFESLIVKCESPQRAIEIFKGIYLQLNFFKIIIKEI